MAPKKMKSQSQEDLDWGVEIYWDRAVELCTEAMEAGLLSYDEAGEDHFWERWIFYKKRGDTLYPGEDHRARWFTEASLFVEFWEEADFSNFHTPEVPMSVAEYKGQNALSSGNVRQGTGSAAVKSESSGPDEKTIGGGLAKQELFGQQPPVAPRAMRERLLGPGRISSSPSNSGGDLAAGLVGAANFLVPNKTECKYTCKCCKARCTDASGILRTSERGSTSGSGSQTVTGMATAPAGKSTTWFVQQR